jgi:paraquat-inducible protein B
MSKKANPKVIGGFVLGALALVVIVFVIFGSAEFFKKTYNFVTYFHRDVTGLRVGSPVKVRGVDVGSVTKITPIFGEEGNFISEVIAKVYEGIIHDTMGDYEEIEDVELMDLLVKRGLRARLESQSIVTGVKYIKLDFFPDSKIDKLGYNKKYYEVPSIPTTQEELSQLLNDAVEAVKALDFDKISNRMQATLENVSSTLEGVDTLVNSPELQGMFSSISKNMDAMEKFITDLDEQLDPLLEERLDVLLADLSDSSKALTKTLERGEKVLAEMEATAVDERYALNMALTEISKSSRAIRLLVDHIQREPRSLIFGKK